MVVFGCLSATCRIRAVAVAMAAMAVHCVAEPTSCVAVLMFMGFFCSGVNVRGRKAAGESRNGIRTCITFFIAISPYTACGTIYIFRILSVSMSSGTQNAFL